MHELWVKRATEFLAWCAVGSFPGSLVFATRLQLYIGELQETLIGPVYLSDRRCVDSASGAVGRRLPTRDGVSEEPGDHRSATIHAITPAMFGLIFKNTTLTDGHD